MPAEEKKSFPPRSLSKALAGMTPRYLHPTDQITFLALDCKLTQSGAMMPATTDQIEQGVNTVLTSPGLHGQKSHGACARTTQLWDAIKAADNTLQDLPGRRVLLVISAGNDHQSQNNFDQTLSYTTQLGIAIFGMRHPDSPFSAGNAGLLSIRNGTPPLPATGSVDDFEALCESSGGLVLGTSPSMLAATLRNFFTLVRSRYILEFPRPDNSTSGGHVIDVTIPGRIAHVLTTGVSTSLPDPATLADPNTVPAAPSPAQMGAHKPPNHTP